MILKEEVNQLNKENNRVKKLYDEANNTIIKQSKHIAELKFQIKNLKMIEMEKQ